MSKYKVSIFECLGLKPFRKTLKASKLAIFGDKYTPKTKADLTTLRQYKPKISIPLWKGKLPLERTIIITNLYNYKQPNVKEGWSVRVTNVEDFRGKSLTYDSHNGTDFSLPPGYSVTAPAPGKVLRISSEFNRGGLKIFIDHGQGIITTLNHLSKTLVKVNDIVKRGQEIAISGYSGIDAILAFPFSPPHVHFNVWLNGEYVDPFAKDNGISIWRNYNNPIPTKEEDLNDDNYIETEFNKEAFKEALKNIIDDNIEEDILSKKNIFRKMYEYNFLYELLPLAF
ncbi:MAG: hypothetical protein KatS3mg068_0607 [Candidatus Sericytochromatia bacterium]|nr:MAG: hypothetical protein KatS3mg068_0607 [Candidatus Sericytochromatia bacterium]